MQRRDLLKASLALTALGLPAFPAFSQSRIADGAGQPFSYERLKKRAQAMAGRPYQSSTEKLPPQLADLAPLKYQEIEYDRTQALWAGQPNVDLRIHFFHVGMQFNVPVRMHAVDPQSQRAREIHFHPKLFDYGDSGIDPGRLKNNDLGFAGFQLAVDPEAKIVQQAAAFLGASYFRAIDENKQYGLSARGLAIDTDVSSGEEFPDFTEFWFVHPEPHSERVTIYALLDSPSTTGVYRFDVDCRDIGAVMDISMDLYTRKAITRLGITPMTSMFLKGTSQPQARDTIYPLIHDSDRLSMWRGNGEWVCRPLYNPPSIQYNAFQDENPRGFGLIQYDHDFNDYRDPVAWYNRRPSLWVEPRGQGFGKGAIALLEMPTVGETIDNIAAFWVPAAPVKAGQHLSFEYKLYWWPEPPVKPGLAEVDKTWSGMGNVPEGWIPGDSSPSEYARRFAIDFVGPPLDTLAADAEVTANVQVSRGRTGLVTTHAMPPIKGYRAIFDWIPESDSTDAVTLRCYLESGGETLTETWMYQWVPPKPADRHY